MAPTALQISQAGYIKGKNVRYSHYGDSVHYRTLTGKFIWYASSGNLIAETEEKIGLLIYTSVKGFYHHQTKTEWH